MDQQPEQPEPVDVDNDVDLVRNAWEGLAMAGAAVPLRPADLDLRHLTRARRAGVDVGAILRTATARSAASGQAAA